MGMGTHSYTQLHTGMGTQSQPHTGMDTEPHTGMGAHTERHGGTGTHTVPRTGMGTHNNATHTHLQASFAEGRAEAVSWDWDEPAAIQAFIR